MGLFSFLFGGGKKKEKARPAAAPPPAKTPASAAAKPEAKSEPKAAARPAEPAAPVAAASAPAPAASPSGVAHLSLVHAACVRANDEAGAYKAACALAALPLLTAPRRRHWRGVADAHFNALLARASADKRRTTLSALSRSVAKAAAAGNPARSGVAATAGRLAGPEAARLALAHTAFLASVGADGRRAV